MSIWYRVFGASDAEPASEELARVVQKLVPRAPLPSFHRDESGWLAAEVVLPGGGSPLVVERYRASDEGMRAELNAWAAWLETCDYSPNHQPLMEKVIQSRQFFALRRPLDHADEARLDAVCLGLCQHLATLTQGFYQIDQQGFFTADGTLLLEEY